MQYKVLFLAIIFFGLLSYYFVHTDNYPTAYVNGRLIFKKEFTAYYNAALVYYQNALRATPEGLEQANTSDFLEEVRRAALDKLVENVLIYKELKRQIGGSLASLIDQKIPEFNEAVAGIYGLTPAQFKNLVLVPQAQREILESKFNGNDSIDDWLAKAKKSAKVLVFSATLKWSGERIEARK